MTETDIEADDDVLQYIPSCRTTSDKLGTARDRAAGLLEAANLPKTGVEPNSLIRQVNAY